MKIIICKSPVRLCTITAADEVRGLVTFTRRNVIIVNIYILSAWPEKS